jgi:formate-dependent nitrite reductase membrane component NrfD
MYYATQDIWTWWIAVYLFFGGMGAAAVAVSCLTDMYLKPHKQLVLWGNLSGFLMLGVGSSLLFFHLLHHVAVIDALNPLVLLRKPDAWIAWGTQFIMWMMVWSLVYSLPYMRDTDFFNRMPLVGKLLQWKPVVTLSELIRKFHRPIGWLATINGVGTVVYTGLLLQSFPAVALWHNPGVPVLFTVSGFSTALAFLLLVQYWVIREDTELHSVRVFYERTDVILIAAELVLIFVFFNYTLQGSESARHSARLLWSNTGWIVGFVLLGLIVPLLIELKGVLKGWSGRAALSMAAVLVLSGGYLLRHYFLYAGVYERPYPPHGYSAHRDLPEAPGDRRTIMVPLENRQVVTRDAGG